MVASAHNKMTFLLLLGFLAACATSSPFAPVDEAASGLDEELRQELLAMLEVDQEVRREIIEAGLENSPDDLRAKGEEIDLENTSRMKEIVGDRGWPTQSMVGEDGATAAFLLVQHASKAPAFRESVLPMLEAAFEAGEASGRYLAMLTDRVRVARGENQLYGTQATIKDGEAILRPIEDESKLDRRRAELGLGPIDEYLAKLQEVYRLD